MYSQRQWQFFPVFWVIVIQRRKLVHIIRLGGVWSREAAQRGRTKGSSLERYIGGSCRVIGRRQKIKMGLGADSNDILSSAARRNKLPVTKHLLSSLEVTSVTKIDTDIDHRYTSTYIYIWKQHGSPYIVYYFFYQGCRILWKGNSKQWIGFLQLSDT
jgi:hypothetical protein